MKTSEDQGKVQDYGFTSKSPVQSEIKKIDFHAHIFPDKIADKAASAIGDFYNIPMHFADGSAGALLKTGTESGISQFVVHSAASLPKHVISINNFIAEKIKQHKEFIGFGALHKDMEDPESEIKRIIDLGLKGIKIHPDTQRFNADDKKMFQIYNHMQMYNLPLLIHAGDYRYDYSHPRRIRNIIDNFPDLPVVAAHFGGWSLWDLAIEFLRDTNCYLDTCSSSKFLGQVRTKGLIRIYGAERIIFGTDFPMWDAKEELEFLYNLKLSDEEMHFIFHKNAERILGI